MPAVCLLAASFAQAGPGKCLRKEDPIVQSLHRWAPKRKEEGRQEEKKVVFSAESHSHC